VEQKLDELGLEDAPTEGRAPTLADKVPQAGETTVEAVPAEEEGGDSDSDGWITPSNLKKHMERDGVASAPSTRSTQRFLQAALITTDYAMQNVALRINLNLISSALCRITRLKSFVLRCHGCFAVTKDMTKQFCPKCGQPTLIRTSCSTDDKGVFQLHLKKNFQWNNRGNVYSIPKPVHGTASGKASKVAGGGKNGWGQKLIFAEDQKEYMKAKNERQKARQRDLMDEDYLPGILTGERSSAGDRIRVGAGRSVNSRKPRR
jgi:RNA-binding protein NOB1